jgi:hypothetical protein
LHISRNFFQQRNIFKTKRRIQFLISIKIAKFPPIVVRFWLMFWGSLEASMILIFNHNMKHLSDFQKRFSETNYLKQSKSNLIFTKMQKRRFDAREALWLAGTLERFVDFFFKWESHTGQAGQQQLIIPIPAQDLWGWVQLV